MASPPGSFPSADEASASVRQVLERAAGFEIDDTGISAASIVLALLEHARNIDVRGSAAAWLRGAVERDAALRNMLEELRARARPEGGRGALGESGHRTLGLARELVSGERIHVRHLVAALLLPGGAPPLELTRLAGEYLAFCQELFRGKEWVARFEAQIDGEPEGDVASPTEKAPAAPSRVRGGAINDRIATEDALGFADYADAIARLLSHQSTSPPLAMSIEGEWGAGKSTLMKFVEERLGTRKAGRVVWFNAWRHEQQQAMLASFAIAMLANLRDKSPWARRWLGGARLTISRFDLSRGALPLLKKVLRWVVGLAAFGFAIALVASGVTNPEGGVLESPLGAVSLFFGSSAAALIGALELARWLREKVGVPTEQDLTKYVTAPSYHERIEFAERFHSDFKHMLDAFVGRDERVFVMIDDLDRCELTKAAELIHALNVLMASEDKRLVFVLAMDRAKVAASLALRYEAAVPYLWDGSGDQGSIAFRRAAREIGHEFLEKFIHVPFSLPRHTRLDDLLDKIMPGSPAGGATRTERPSGAAVPGDGQSAAARPEASAATPASPSSSAEEEADSDDVREAARNMLPFLGGNPRRLKQFVNLFRLHLLLGERRSQRLPPDRLAAVIVLALRWPDLVALWNEEPLAVERLIEAIRERKEIPAGLEHWGADRVLSDLVATAGIDARDLISMSILAAPRAPDATVRSPAPAVAS